MDLDRISFFAMAKKRLAWLTQRQEVLAQNIANADTPQYRSKDLEPFAFERLVRRESAQINMDVTEKGHLGGRRKRLRDFTEEKERKPFETAPAGNAVVLEEQMGKLNENHVSHKLTVELYNKQLKMLKMAVESKS